MAIQDMIPTLVDADLNTLRANAERLSREGSPKQKAAADALLPQIIAEQEGRAAAKPPRAPARKRASKAHN
jgi:hypothetical protein